MRKSVLVWGLAFCSGTIAGTIGSATKAYAFTVWKTMAADACLNIGGGAGSTAPPQYIGGAITNNSTSGVINLECPFPEDDRLPHGSVNGISVDTYDSTNKNWTNAAACVVSSSTGLAGSCGALTPAPSTSPGTGHVSLNPSLDEWHNNTAGYYAYVVVGIGPNDSTFMGIAFTN